MFMRFSGFKRRRETLQTPLLRARERVYVCVCVRERERVSVCVCV